MVPPMRILVVTRCWDLIGGSERYARAVVPELRARGHELVVLCGQGGEESEVGLERLPELFDPRVDGAKDRRIAERIRALSPERILLLSRVRAAPLGALLAAAPLVRFVQDHTLFCPGLNKLHEDGSLCTRALGAECLRRYFLADGCSGLKVDGAPSLRFPLHSLRDCLRELELTRRARRVLVASRYMAGELYAAGLPHQLVEVLPYFTRSNSPRLAREALPETTRAFVEHDSRPLLFTPTRLATPDKGVEYLLTAMEGLRDRARLVVAGEGPARPWLERKARDEGLLESVHFSGWLPPGVIESLYAAASVVVCPSVWNEPFGLVGIEAMAHSLPVVAFDVGGIGEWLVHGETGLVCERRNAAALRNAIEEVLEDPESAYGMGASGRERLERGFSVDSHVAALEEAF